jgi:hypothetical protein
MSGTDDGEKRRGAGRSGSAGSIGKELGEDLDFEADALLDSLLSDDSIAPKAPSARPGSKAPSAAPPASKSPSEAPPSEGRVLHAPKSREFPDDEPTWVGAIDSATSLELQAIAAKLGTGERAGSAVLPPPATSGAPAIPALPPPPAFAPPRPLPRSTGASAVPRPASRAPTPARGSGTSEPPGNPPAKGRELPVFDHDDEVTRVQTLPTLHDIDSFIERNAKSPSNSAATARPPADYSVETSAQPLEELELPDEVESLGSSSSAALSLGDLDFEDAPVDDIDALLGNAGAARDQVAPSAEQGNAELSDAELEALAEAELAEFRESEPPRAPLSHTPPPPDLHSSPSMWPDERPAAAHLAPHVDRWTERAEWLEAEAHAATDPIAKARTLLVASEIWALVGDIPRAREVATEASAMARSLPLVGRQLRALAAAEHDWKAVATAMDHQTRRACTPRTSTPRSTAWR